NEVHRDGVLLHGWGLCRRKWQKAPARTAGSAIALAAPPSYSPEIGDKTMTDLSAEFKALAEYRPTNTVRFVTAAALFDGPDAAINIMRRILISMGAEVIHLGHNRPVDE